MRKQVFCSAAITCIAGFLMSGEHLPPFPKDMPPLGVATKFKTSPIRTVTLDNGLAVWLAPVPGVPKVSINLLVKGGYLSDPEDKLGLSEVLAASLKEGTKDRNAAEIANQIQGCGGDLRASSTKDNIMLETTVLTDKAGVALDLIGDVAQRASFDAAGVKRARERITSILQTKEGSPIFLADRAFQHLLFGNTGHGTAYPSRSTIDSISISDLQDSYIRQFRPDRAVLVVAGDFDEGTVRSKIQDSFGHWNKRGSTTGDPLVRTRVLHQDRNTVWYIPRPGSVQTTLLLAAVAPTEGDPEYVQAALANLVLGGMDFGSRLVANLREDKGYGYHPSSTLLPFGDTGIFVLLADVKNGVTGAAFNEILYELNRLSTTTASEDEMQRARRYFAGWQTITLQTRSRLAWTLAQYWAHGLHPEYLSAQQHKAAAVTAVDVQNAARNLFIPSKLTFLAVGDEDVILRELAPFGWELKRLQ